MNEQSLARGLAAFSVGLGVAELIAPRQLARLIGLDHAHHPFIRLLGLREIANGLGLMQGKPGCFHWSRVAGDALDLTLLGAATRSAQHDRRRLNAALTAVAGITALDVAASILATRDRTEPGWRVADSGRYAAGCERADPRTSRAYCDEAMAAESSRAFGAEDDRGFDRFGSAPGGNALDELAGYDDGLEETERATDISEAGNPS